MGNSGVDAGECPDPPKTNISPSKGSWEDDFPLPKVG